MPYLTKGQRDELADAILESVGYSVAIRANFFAEINSYFLRVLDVDLTNQQVQLDLDINRLNRTERLTDSTIPFHSWLQNAERYVRAFPEAKQIIQQALAVIEGKTIKAAPLSDSSPPSPVAVANIVQERIIHQNDMVSYAWLEAGTKAGIGVARLLISRFENGQKTVRSDGSAFVYSGTGWLLTNQLIITNHHVINAREDHEPDAASTDFNLQAKGTIVEFDYNSDSIPGSGVLVLEVVASDIGLDYAILRLKTSVERRALARFLHEVVVTEHNPQAVNIIQHPFGHSKKVAFRNNHIFGSPYPRIRYFTDTEKGSSGSPVFDDKWQAIALHRASQLVEDIDYQGKSTGWINEGTQLIAIFDHLDKHFREISIEILNN